MAQLKDLIVTGASRFIGDVIANQLQITKLNAPTAAGGTTYGSGSNGQVLLSNGSSVYWGSAAPTVTESTVSDWGFVKIGTSATTAAAGNHTHDTSLAADSGTASVTLAHNTTYKLTAGGTNVIFKTPSIPTAVSSFTNDAGYITSADVPEGASAYTGTISAVGTTASTGTNNGFARGDHVHNITKATINSVLGTGSGTAKFYREDGTWATPAYIANTDEKLKIAAVTSGTTYYPIVAENSAAAANRQYDATGFAYTGTNGTTSTVGAAKITLGNSTASGTANNKQGSIVLYGSTAYATTITPGGPTAARTITLPNATGTVALAANPTIATDSGTATVSLAANTTYKLTAGGGSLIFKTPADGNTDTKVTQAAAITTNGSYPVLLGYDTGTAAVTNTVNKSSTLTYNPSIKQIKIGAANIGETGFYFNNGLVSYEANGLDGDPGFIDFNQNYLKLRFSDSESNSIELGNNGLKINDGTGVGTNGQVLMSDGTKAYWGSAASSVTESTVSGWGFTKNAGTVTSITINTTSPISGGSSTATTTSGTYTISLADGYGDTKNPYASKTKNYVLAAPSTANGAPTFRALATTDLPTVPVSKGGTGMTTATNKNAVVIGNNSTATGAMQTVRTASGAFYATAQDAKPTFGTLPVAQGGTGQTSIANIQAGKDGDGNTISSTYVKKAGDTMTGNLTIGTSTDTVIRELKLESDAGNISLFSRNDATEKKQGCWATIDGYKYWIFEIDQDKNKVFWGRADSNVLKSGDTMTGPLVMGSNTQVDGAAINFISKKSDSNTTRTTWLGYSGGSNKLYLFDSTNNKVILDSDENGVSNFYGRADTAQKAQGVFTASIAPNNSSETHADTLKKWFDNNKASIPRDQFVACYDSTGSNGSMTFGYFLNGYDSNPYGGFFTAHYNMPYYIGISNGTYKQFQIWKKGDAVTGAVYNDYAEYRESHDTEFGYVVQELGDDTLQKTTKRLSHFAGVTSDTWGFAQGETEKAKTPIAVAGRVLVYPGEDRNKYQPGDCVCAGPGGKVYIMTREEIKEWPDRIVGTVSCVPDYDTWGIDYDEERPKVKVNGRIWIKVR